jgi:hypothetical protein
MLNDIFSWENAVRNFEVEIKLLKNKAIRYELKFKQIDNEMFEAFTSKFNPDILVACNFYFAIATVNYFGDA